MCARERVNGFELPEVAPEVEELAAPLLPTLLKLKRLGPAMGGGLRIPNPDADVDVGEDESELEAEAEGGSTVVLHTGQVRAECNHCCS